jgi:2,5-furandicarboxylate decarboxylase 1
MNNLSLRTFLDVLQKDKDLLEIDYDCSPEYEVASHIRKSCDENGPALLFRSEEAPGIRILGSLYGSERRIRRILSKDYSNEILTDVAAVKKFSSAANNVHESNPLSKYSRISPTAECQEVVVTGKDVDLTVLPICTHNELDKGPFITAGVNVVKWFDGTHGLGIHRMNVINKSTLSCLAPPNRRVGFPHYKKTFEEEGIKMAVVIGGPPEVVLASQAKVNQRTEKYGVAAELAGTKLPLTKCITSDILVPANAELVIECTSLPESYWDDTPFGEYPGTYSVRSNSWKCRVDAITHRKDFMYQTILTGKTPQEDSNLCAIPYSSEVYRVAANFVEEVTDIAAFIGNNVFDTILCIKKNSNEEVQNLIYQLLGNKYLKSVTIMDHDLKANDHDWRFAFNTRYQPNKDTTITNLALGASLDPSSPLFQSTSKVAFDFTVPIGKNSQQTEHNWMRHKVVNTKPGIIVPSDSWSR